MPWAPPGRSRPTSAPRSLETGCIPPTINYRHPDPELTLDYVPNEARAADVRVALSNSMGLGGHNSSVILRRFEE